MDNVSKEMRSKNMSAIKSSDTRPEKKIRSILFAAGYRYRKNYKNLPGKPDIYFPGKHIAVFIHGCFWHRHKECKFAFFPNSNTEFWEQKFISNVARDSDCFEKLHLLGIRTILIWECTVKKIKSDEDAIEFLDKFKEAFSGNSIHTVIK